MLPLYQYDIARLHQAGRKFVSVRMEPVRYKDEWWYEMHLFVEGVEEPMVLITQRRQVRRFKSLDKAVGLVKASLPEIAEAIVRISR